MLTGESLARALWAGPLADPGAPARALARSGEQDYRRALASLQRIVAARLPAEPALGVARGRWPWSIELALLAVETAADRPGRRVALEALAALCVTQNRRRAAYARAAWRLGEARVARAFLAALDPASETAAEDRAAGVELALLDGDLAAAEAGVADLAARPALQGPLALRLAHARAGAPALALPEPGKTAPAVAALLFDLALGERDFALARAAAGRLSQTLGPDHPDSRAVTIRLALEAGDPALALALLEPGLDPQAPWRWPVRAHVQWLRTQVGLARTEDDPAPRHRTILTHAEAALRLHGRHEVLRATALGCLELGLDWDRLADRLRAEARRGGDIGPVVTGLIRLGLPEAALAAPGSAPPGQGTQPRARRLLAMAEARLAAGESDAALALLDTAAALPLPVPLAADVALQRAECLVWLGEVEAAEAALTPLRGTCPTRPGLWLMLSRAAFLRGDAPMAEAALVRFRALRTAQTGLPPPEDLRDRITADALASADEGSPARAALALYRAAPTFCPAPGGAIPRRLVHYWEGPRSLPAERGLAAWTARHPGFESRCFDRDTAAEWLARHHPALLAAFQAQPLPATRADLFRIAWLLTEGGIYTDVDEYPRAPVLPWLDGARAVFCREAGYSTVANNFIAAEPGLPLMRRLLDRIAAALAANPAPYPWWDTGPAPLTVELARAFENPQEAPGLRLLDQAEYCRRVSTNLPFPHKRSARHWR